MGKKNYKASQRQLVKIILFVFIITILNLGSSASGSPVVYKKNSTGKIYRVMARAYMAYGEYAKAMPLAEKALGLAQKQKAGDEELANCLGDLSYIYLNLDRFADAEKFSRLSIELQKKFYYDRHPYVAYSLRNLAAIYQGQGRFADANDAMQEAFAIMLESHPADAAVFAPFEVDYARLLVAEGKLQQAEQYYNKAMELISQTYGEDHLYSAAVTANVAELYTLQGRYSEAEPLVNKSQALQERYYGRENHLIAPAYLTKAAICRAKGNTAESDSFIQMARNSIQKTGNDRAIEKLEQKIVSVRQVKADTSAPVVKLINSAS